MRADYWCGLRIWKYKVKKDSSSTVCKDWEHFVFNGGIDFPNWMCLRGKQMWRNSDGKIYENQRWRSLRGFPFSSESPAGISLMQRLCLKTKNRVRGEPGQCKERVMSVLHLTVITSVLFFCFCFLQLHSKWLVSHCRQSQRLGFFPPALSDGLHDHASLPGPVPSLLCLCHGATLAVLPRCWCRGYGSGERGLLWHTIPTRRPLPPGQTQTPSQHSPQLLICWW